MIKDSTYTEKFMILKDWIPYLIESIKKDLKNEHLKRDFQFMKQFLGNVNVQKLTTEELVKGYTKALAQLEQSEKLAEYISNRWLLRHTELYHHFEEKLAQISPNFNDLEELTPQQSKELMESAVKEFGAVKTYLFSILNSVVFTQDTYNTLQELARKEMDQREEEQQIKTELNSIESIKREYETQIQRLTDRYEKKLLGMTKKYQQDVEGLKKQISSLQRKAVQQ